MARNRSEAKSEKQTYSNERDDTEIKGKDLEMPETTVKNNVGAMLEKIDN